MAQEITLNIREAFIGNQELSHNAFNFYWPQGEKTEIRVMMEIRKDLTYKIVVEYRTDLLSHPYFILSRNLGAKLAVKKT